MELVELKECLQRGKAPTSFMIFITKDNPFLAKQYLQVIEKLKGEVAKIKSIYEPSQSSFSLLTASTDTLNILKVDTFEERAENYSQFENTIVVCEQVDKSIANSVKNYLVHFPKLEEWQIFAYAKKLCSNLEDEDLLWLIRTSDNDIERVSNELDKVALFNKEDQKSIFNAIRFDPQTDLYKTDLFTVTDALIEGNFQILFDYLKHSNYADLDPVMLANRALSKLKNIILVTQNPLLTAEELGISKGYYNHLKYNYSSTNINAVKQKIKFLTNFDLDLKTSKLDLSKRDLLNYLIINLGFKIAL